MRTPAVKVRVLANYFQCFWQHGNGNDWMRRGPSCRVSWRSHVCHVIFLGSVCGCCPTRERRNGDFSLIHRKMLSDYFLKTSSETPKIRFYAALVLIVPWQCASSLYNKGTSVPPCIRNSIDPATAPCTRPSTLRLWLCSKLKDPLRGKSFQAREVLGEWVKWRNWKKANFGACFEKCIQRLEKCRLVGIKLKRLKYMHLQREN